MKHIRPWLTKNIIGFGITSFFNDISHEMINVILPIFIEQLIGPYYAPFAVGLMSSLADGVSSLIKLWSGFFVDTMRHYKLFLIIGYTMTPLFLGCIGFVTHIWQVIVCKIIAWAGKGIREPVRDSWLATIVHPSSYGHAFGFVRTLDTCGAIIGPLIAWVALYYVPLKTVFFIAFIPGLCSVLALICITQEERSTINLQAPVTMLNQLRSLPKNFNYFVFIMFIFNMGNFNRLLIIYRVQELLQEKSDSFTTTMGLTIALYVLFNIIRALSEYTLGGLSDYINRKYLLSFGGFGLFGLTALGLSQPIESLWIWIILFIGVGISTGTVSSVERSYAAHLLPASTRGTGFGLLHMIDGIGLLCSSLGVGMLWSFMSPTIGFVYAAVLSFTAMILLLRFSPSSDPYVS